jgi:hypothetical protein
MSIPLISPGNKPLFVPSGYVYASGDPVEPVDKNAKIIPGTNNPKVSAVGPIQQGATVLYEDVIPANKKRARVFGDGKTIIVMKKMCPSEESKLFLQSTNDPKTFVFTKDSAAPVVVTADKIVGTFEERGIKTPTGRVWRLP